MDLAYMQALPMEGGFNYDNCFRNMALTANRGMGLQTNVETMKTGTTICGLIFKVREIEIHSKDLKINQICVGWSCTRCRYKSYWWKHRRRQELREDP